jgi:hypothetical protein
LLAFGTLGVVHNQTYYYLLSSSPCYYRSSSRVFCKQQQAVPFVSGAGAGGDVNGIGYDDVLIAAMLILLLLLLLEKEMLVLPI